MIYHPPALICRITQRKGGGTNQTWGEEKLHEVMREYAQQIISQMEAFVDSTSLYKGFPKTLLTVTNNVNGNLGGVGRKAGKLIPIITLSAPDIDSYTKNGFREYSHIASDPEIGSIFSLSGWKHTTDVVLSHEMAHAVVNLHDVTKRHGLYVPKKYRAYSVGLIEDEYILQKKQHGRHWQYTYRQIRNEFSNQKIYLAENNS